MNERLSNIAVLIDADNTAAGVIDEVIANITELGNIGTKRIYGDWSHNHLKSWQDAILKYAITPIQQFAYTKGKNATDINMVIDAMDLLIDGQHDGFCLVSSDSDFAPLASKVRAKGYKVFGFGKKNTPESFKKSCDQFICIDPSDIKESMQTQENSIKISNEIKKLIIDIIQEKADESGWVKMETLASTLMKKDPSFSAKKYGFSKFYLLLNSISELVIQKQNNGYVCSLKNKTNVSISPKAKIAKLPQAEKDFIFDVIAQHADENGWAKIGLIGKCLKDKNINYKDYGFAKLSTMLKAIAELESKFVDNVFYYRSILPAKNTNKTNEKLSNESNQNQLRSESGSGRANFEADKNKMDSKLSDESNPSQTKPLEQEKSSQPQEVKNRETKNPAPRCNFDQIRQEIFKTLKNSSHKKRWVSLTKIEENLKLLDADFQPQVYSYEDLSALLESFGLQCLENDQTQEAYYRKIPFLELINQFKKVSKRTDIDLHDENGNIKAAILERYAHFNVHYGKYGFDSFMSFFLEVQAYYERKKVNHHET